MEDPAARVVAAVDAERRRLERRLHDGAQQQLVAVSVNLQLLDQLFDTDAEAGKTLLAEIRDDVRDAVAELRLLAARISPPIPGMRGLAASLRAAAGVAGVPARVDVWSTQECPAEVATTIYLCFLQALESVASHGTTSVRVAVDVRDGDGAVVVEITGLEIHESNAAGLSLMEARFAALGGGFTVIAEPGNGTRLTGTLPLRDD